MILATITITHEIEDDGTPTTGYTVEPADTPLITILGLLELAKDTALTMAADDEP